MSTFKMPLSGDVTQSISPMTWWMSPIGSQFGLININMGQSSAPKVEEDLLSDFGIMADRLAASPTPWLCWRNISNRTCRPPKKAAKPIAG